MRRGRFVIGSVCVVAALAIAASAGAAPVVPLPRLGGVKVLGLLFAEALAPLVGWGFLGRLRA